MIDYSQNAGKQYHTQLGPEDVGRYVLLPGDPGRCAKIAQYLDDAKEVAHNREFMTWTGSLEGERVSVTSTGIGGPSAAIAMEELHLCGADTFLRIGTCGGIQPEVKSGDIVIATGAVRMEGTTREYAPLEYPAVASLDVVNALVSAASDSGLPFHTGVVQSKDSFFGQHSPEIMPVAHQLKTQWEAWKRLGCLASEMESAAVFIVAARLRARAGTSLLVMANQERALLGLDNPVVHDNDRQIRIAVEAMRRLILADRKKAASPESLTSM